MLLSETIRPVALRRRKLMHEGSAECDTKTSRFECTTTRPAYPQHGATGIKQGMEWVYC